jgi:hypothetical protein
MRANLERGTPGMIHLAFAVAMLLAAFGAWSQARQSMNSPAIQPLTGLGDAAYYSSISENDFYNPALIFPEFPRGIFRRTVKPVHRVDGKMRVVGKESSGKFSLYTDAKPKSGPDGGLLRRWYLKAADNQYVEFGERKFWPSYTPAKS